MEDLTKWRLPTHEELKSLVWDQGEGAESYYCDAFVSARDWFLSSDVAGDHVLVVHFLDGFAGKAGLNSFGMVRLVADSGSVPTWIDGCCPSERYLDKGDAVLDAKTGLLWQKYPEGKFQYEEAVLRWSGEAPREEQAA